MMMLGDKVTADEALAWGMIYRVVEPEALAGEAAALADRLAGGATRGLGLTKRLINRSLASDLEAQLEAEAMLQAEAGRTADHAEGVAAFREKRAPTFEGR
jgi:2-(1,2-epoxy-1,2-dihydrophenyl)acetyl-CoA isomerase